ncbi:RICIN domain-containing protein [Aeromonas enteropelogenes]|uniref:RICIN domain-containing protein n=1 Tax=Aeromonas enteropelogenes TaxID=29489 RepID=UPI00191F3B84|nr:RICIN domain-containing protein [Aeromonas enteropelogenes]MBL0456884.1 RICIN domain-containing protein [Aeromonas enteropelogenes]
MKKHTRFMISGIIGLGCFSFQYVWAAVTAEHTPPEQVFLVNDSPGFSFIDETGKYLYHDTLSQYNKYNPNNADHAWRFFSAKNYQGASDNIKDKLGDYEKIKQIYDQATVQNTVPLCTNTPLMKRIKPRGSGYDYINYCGLMDVWVDPDSGDWYGLLHDEIFGLTPRYDAIELVKSTDKGLNWAVTDVIQTSQYGMTDSRDEALGQTYNYGGGDPRLFVDYASGYFYLFYTSRVMNLSGWSGFSSFMQEHVMRAPISGKMSPESWRKYHDGKWEAFSADDYSLGNAGAASNIVSVELSPKGYFTPEYDPATMSGTASELAGQGKLVNSPLRVINVAWNSYLKKYVATPEPSSGPKNEGKAPLEFYVTDSLSSQKWEKLLTLDNYVTRSWYRFMMDPQVQTRSNFIVGKTFRTYCYVECQKYGGEYIDVTLQRSPEDNAPTLENTLLKNRDGEVLTADDKFNLAVKKEPGEGDISWGLQDRQDGYYSVVAYPAENTAQKRYLGVAGSGAVNDLRKWAAEVGLLDNPCQDATADECLSAQWIKVPTVISRDDGSERRDGSYRLVNRFSGLTLNLDASQAQDRQVTLSPFRSWDCTGATCKDRNRASSQILQ